MNVLVIGGAGYIGSHCVRQLIEAGHNPIVLDNLVYGHRAALKEGVKFYKGNLEDKEFVGKILDAEKIDIVMHFAAFINVGESVKNPIKYYHNNLAGVINLIETMIAHNVKKFVFSSTCATYGVPKKLPLTEDHPQLPINPYGQTKLDVENFLKACARAYGLSFVALRYFNASGAAEDGTIGEDHTPETHLIPLTIFAAMGKIPSINVIGQDYNTPDGTCLRDSIHVDDLCRAHIAAFKNSLFVLVLQPRNRHPKLGKGNYQGCRRSDGLESPCRVRRAPRRRPRRPIRKLTKSQDGTKLENKVQRRARNHRNRMALA